MTVEFKDYYQILGVERSAPAAEIKRSYRKLARKYHPDVSKEKNAEQHMKEVNEAYEVLGDPEKRAAYDQLGTRYHGGEEFRPPPDWETHFEFTGGPFAGHETDFSDFFNSLFGASGPRARGTGGVRQADQHARISIDLDDAFHGATRAISLSVPEVDPQGRLIRRERILQVHIPKGICAGQIIRLAGQGASTSAAGRVGDLYLEVQFKPHAFYRVDGRDLYLTLPVTPWEAALGGTVKAPTPGGAVAVHIPVNSQNGRKLRLKGRGIPGDPPGDVYLLLDIVLPAAHSQRAKKLYETMARELAFNPRGNLGV